LKKIFIIFTLFLILGFQNGCKKDEISPVTPGDVSYIREITDLISADSLANTVEVLSNVKGFVKNSVQVNILSRHSADSCNNIAGVYLQQRLLSYLPDVKVENFCADGNNILAELHGKKYPERKIIICAHYDDMPEQGPAPGADDNASGCAAVIEAARVLSKYELNCTVVFALWDCEEQGLIGSVYHSDLCRQNNEIIDAVINIDMIGFDKNNDSKMFITLPYNVFPLSISETAKFINENLKIGLDVKATDFPLGSDHLSFLSNGYNSSLFIEDLLYDKNTFYHAADDRFSAFNKPYFLKIVKLTTAVAAYLAERE
jgi:hypothetical protein